MIKRLHSISFICLSGVFLILDQVLKYLARTNPEFSAYIWKNWIGWEYLANTGIAFSLPFPNWLLITLTPFILLFLLYLVFKKRDAGKLIYLGVFLIISGALSNFIDRVLFAVTIDYLRFFTSVINLADIIIVLGAGFWILGGARINKID